MSSYLQQMIERKEKEVACLLQATPYRKQLEVLQRKERGPLFSQIFGKNMLSVIAEVKRSSPSLGTIASIEDPIALASQYAEGGASAFSVLTDFEGFGGTLEDLASVAKAHPKIPVLRKDFILHPIQLAEAVFAGASAVLLIVAVLGEKLGYFLEEAHRLGLEALVEVHDRKELELALAAGSSLIGVNHRNLSTFQIHYEVSQELRPLIPSYVMTVAESGINSPALALEMQRLGYHAVLVGEALVRSEDPAALIRSLREVER